MYPFAHNSRDLTTEQGLPIDASQAVPAATFSFDQPVYRSIDVLAPPSMAPSFVEPPVFSRKSQNAFVDVPMLTKPVLKAPAVQVERASSSTLEAPRIDPMLCPLERTRFDVELSALQAILAIKDLFNNQLNVVFEQESESELACSVCCDSLFQSATFHVRVLATTERKSTVEFQRRSGCPRLFNSVFRRTKANWHQCATQKSLAAPALKRNACSSLEGSEQWTCLVNWMHCDAREAIRSVAALANQGAVVPDCVMSALVGHLQGENKVEALQAITAAVPHHRLEGFEDQILGAISGSLSSGLIEEREACKFVAKIAEELPHLLSRPSCNFCDKLAAASSSQWCCTRQFAQQSLSIMQAAPEVY